MNYRQQCYDYFFLPWREFRKKYRIGHDKAERLFGKKSAISKHFKEDIIALHNETKLYINEIIPLLDAGYTMSEIRQGHWEIANGEIKFIPKNIYESR